MTICSAHDGEVCYESQYCPACGILEQLENAEYKIAKLEDEISDIRSEIAKLNGVLSHLKI
jgi:transcription initiation factor IIE alpha subunit